MIPNVAAVAAIHLWYDDLDVQAYLSDLEKYD